MSEPSPATPPSPRAPVAATASVGAAPEPHGLRGRLHATLDAIRAKPTGRITLKIVVGVLGALVVAAGIVLIPLPGPGWAIVVLGLAIWALEFAWARNLLSFTRRHLRNWTHWVGRQSLGLRLFLGAVGLVFVSGVVWLSLKAGFNIDLYVMCRDFLATR